MPGTGSSGPPLAGGNPWPVRVGLGVVVAVYVAGALFGVAAPFLWGHHGYHGATYMLRAIMTLRFHIITPSNWAGYEYPPRFSWYFHHPIGYHHLLVPLVWLLGAREWVGRGFAAAGGLLVIAALYALVRRAWSRELGLLAAAVFVAMPFVTQYAVLLDPMWPTMALTLVALDCFLRFWDLPERRTLATACTAFIGAGLLMWDGYLEALLLGLWALALLLTPTGRRARLLSDGRATRTPAFLAWFVATGVASAMTMGLHFLFTWKVGMMSDFRSSYAQRHAAAFDFVYGREQEWASLLFGRPLIVAGVLWLVVFAGRAVAGYARRRDLAVLTFLVNKTVYIYLFREAAAVHEYRVDWYLVFLTLAVVDLCADAGALTRHLVRRWPAAATAPAAVMLLAAGGLLALEVPLGWHKLIESRERMGTDGPGYNADYPRQLFAMEVARRTGPEDFVFTLTTGFPRRIEFYFYMDRSNLDIHTLAQLPALRQQHPRSLVILDPSAVAGADREALLDLLRHHPAAVYDGFMVVDLRDDRPGLSEYSFAALPSSWAYRYFVSHRFPAMQAVPRKSTALECLYADLGLPIPASSPPPPSLGGPPLLSTPQGLCHHNYLVLRGDRPGAAAMVERLRATTTRADAPLGGALRLLALRFDPRGTADLWLRLDGKLAPTAGSLRLRLSRQPPPGVPAPPPLVVEQRLAPALALQAPGTIALEHLPLRVARGAYLATVELVAAPPARGAPAVPSAPSPGAIADLGRVEIR